MLTKYTIFLPSGEEILKETDLPEEPDYNSLRKILNPILENGWLEHIYVLLHGQTCDFFVDEEGKLKNLPRNEKATQIYRAQTLQRFPKIKPESLDFVVGPAILFYRKVWF